MINPTTENSKLESKYISIRGNRIHYYDEGLGKPILMLSCNPLWSYSYRNLIKEFSKNNRVIAPDYIGSGLSDKPRNYQYNLENHIDNLERLICELDLEDMIMVMHGIGATVGMGMAQRHPNKIAGLIFLNSTAFTVELLPLRLSVFRIPKLGSMLNKRFNLYQKLFLSFTGSNRIPKLTKKKYMLPYRSFNSRIGIDEFIKDIPINLTHLSYETVLEIEHGLWMFKEHPSMIIWSAKDWRYPLSMLKKWKEIYPQAKVKLMKESGAIPMEDSLPKVKSYIKEFLLHDKLNH